MLNFHEALKNKKDQHAMRGALHLKYKGSSERTLLKLEAIL